ncbi:Hypothetical protein HDN1F_16030 [gamma proteobacterium HdN1]|nr:Hypothetical protein HDN1F_16030 [gamma proteobacterium HdN1]
MLLFGCHGLVAQFEAAGGTQRVGCSGSLIRADSGASAMAVGLGVAQFYWLGQVLPSLVLDLKVTSGCFFATLWHHYV